MVVTNFSRVASLPKRFGYGSTSFSKDERTRSEDDLDIRLFENVVVSCHRLTTRKLDLICGLSVACPLAGEGCRHI